MYNCIPIAIESSCNEILCRNGYGVGNGHVVSGKMTDHHFLFLL